MSSAPSSAGGGLDKVPDLVGPSNWRLFDRKIRQWIVVSGLGASLKPRPAVPNQPADNNTETAKEDFKRQRAKREHFDEVEERACEGIRSKLGENAWKAVKGMIHVEAVLAQLKTDYAPKGDGALHELWKEFISLKLSDFDSVIAYSEKFTEVHNEIQGLSDETTLPDWLLIMSFLTGLPSGYDFFKTSLRQTSTILEIGNSKLPKLSISDVIVKTVAEEKCIVSQDSFAANNVNVAATTSRSSDQVCAHAPCGKRGHTELTCWMKNPNLMPDFIKKRIAKRKSNNPQQSSQHKNKKRKNDDEGDSSDTYINVLCEDLESLTFSATGALESRWYLDTASQRHVVDDRKHFITYTKYHTPTKFCKGIGGHRMPIVGYGEVEVLTKVKGKSLHRATITNVFHCPGLGTNLLSYAQLKAKNKMAITDKGFSCKGKNGNAINFVEDNGLFMLENAVLSKVAEK